jgi:hypothetical protein
MVYILGSLVIVDTYFDVRGYNQALYGDSGNLFDVIPQPTPSWLVTVGILVALCSFGELLGREVFVILGRKSRSKRLGLGGGDVMVADAGGGSLDLGGMDFGDMDFGGEDDKPSGKKDKHTGDDDLFI